MSAHEGGQVRGRSGPPPDPLPDGMTFVGTATTILRLGRFTVLTDPNFLRRGQRAYLGRACGPHDGPGRPPSPAVRIHHTR